MIKIATILLGGLRRAFTKSGGSLATVTAPMTNAYDLEAYIALFLRGLVAIALAWVALKLGVPIPDINTL
jgi:small basic protein